MRSTISILVPMTTATRSSTTRVLALAVALDIVLVLVFAAIGRRSHAEGVTVGGTLSTAWPFLIGLAVGWGATVALYRDKLAPLLVLPTGVLVWVATVVGGMVVRRLIGEGTAVSFVVVASVTLAVFLLGWRALVRIRTRGTERARRR